MLSCCVTSSPESQKAKYLVGNLDKYDEGLQGWFQAATSPCLLIENQPKQNNDTRKDKETTTNQSGAIGAQGDSNQQDSKDRDDIQDVSAALLTQSEPHLFASISSSPVTMYGRQTYRMWKAMIEMNESFPFRTRILDIPKILHFYPLETVEIQNLDDFDINGCNFLQFMVTFLDIFFPGLTVIQEDLFDININMTKVKSRHHKVTNKKQFLVGDLYRNLHLATGAPRKHYILGMTWTDLYPKEELNFVLGEASRGNRCAVLGFGRFEPKSYKEGDGDVELQMDGRLMWQLLRVASHETCHLFGLKHCVFFNCAMNESKSVKAALEQPLFLCPVCLRKLQKFLGFDIRTRYSAFLELCVAVQNVYPSEKLGESIEWLKRCLASLLDPEHE